MKSLVLVIVDDDGIVILFAVNVELFVIGPVILSFSETSIPSLVNASLLLICEFEIFIVPLFVIDLPLVFIFIESTVAVPELNITLFDDVLP